MMALLSSRTMNGHVELVKHFGGIGGALLSCTSHACRNAMTYKPSSLLILTLVSRVTHSTNLQYVAILDPGGGIEIPKRRLIHTLPNRAISVFVSRCNTQDR